MSKLPKIKKTEVVATSKLFKIETVDLQFQNGHECQYERIRGNRGSAVLIVPMLDEHTVLLVREYAVGVERYELSCPKGIVESHETLFEAADRELKEEIGYGAKSFSPLKALTTAPGYLASNMSLLLAKELYPCTLEGDEPEEIEVVPWSLNRLDELLKRDDFTEARSVAALYMVRDAKAC